MRESTRGIRWCAPVQSRCTIAVCCTMFEQPLRNVYFCCHGRQRVCVHDMGIHPSLLGVVTSCASPWSNNHCGTFLWSCQQVSYIGVAPGMVPAVVGCVCVCVCDVLGGTMVKTTTVQCSNVSSHMQHTLE